MMEGIALFFVALLGAGLGEAMGEGMKKNLPLLLSFGGAFLLGLCFLHLLPEAFVANGHAGFWVIGGFLVQIGLEYLSKGMEHGHVHGNRFGLLAFISLCLHAFIEAMPFGLEGQVKWCIHTTTTTVTTITTTAKAFGRSCWASACTSCRWPLP